jgi:hypothetical protein
MVAGYTYSTYVTQLANLAVVDSTDSNFVTNLPSAIDSAELRIMQDLDLLSTVSQLTGVTLTANNRNYTFPITAFITLQQINVITPVSTTLPDSGTRNPCFPTSKEELDFTYPSVTGAGVPSRFAMLSQNQVIFGPWPDQAYSLELIGTVRPASLSASNVSTFISTYLPDLFMAASMIYIAGYQRDFGRQSDDPQMSVSWQSFYEQRKAASFIEENRKKFWSNGWTSRMPAPTATPDVGQYPAARG